MAKIVIFHVTNKFLGHFFYKIPIFNDYLMKKQKISRNSHPKTTFFDIKKEKIRKKNKREMKEIKQI